MLSNAIYAQLLDAPVIQSFSRSAPEVLAVGSASAAIRGYVDVPVEVAGVTVHHPLLVVEGLACPLLIGTDILRAHGAVLTHDKTAIVRLRNRECSICREQRTELPVVSFSAPLSACGACSAVTEPCTAEFIRAPGLACCAEKPMLLPSPSRRCSNSLAAPRSPPAPRMDLRTNRARKSPLHALPPTSSTARRTPTSSPRAAAASSSATSTSAARSAPFTSCLSPCASSAPSAHSPNE